MCTKMNNIRNLYEFIKKSLIMSVVKKECLCLSVAESGTAGLFILSESKTIFMDIICNKFKAGVVFLINNTLQFTLGRFDAASSQASQGSLAVH